jgi:hypothetical protein
MVAQAPSVTIRYLVRVAGSLSNVVTEAVRDRFGSVDVRRYPTSTVLAVGVRDQPGLRSLLVTLFDVGHEVLSITQEEDPPLDETNIGEGA